MRVGSNVGNLVRARQAAIGLALALLLLGVAAAQAIPSDPDTLTSPRSFLRVRFEGYLRAQATDKWLVGERVVVISEHTDVIEKNGRAEVGAWLIVWGSKDITERVYAEVIEVDRPAGQRATLQQITGPLAKKTSKGWIINDIKVLIDEQTAIPVMPELGNYVAAQVELREDGWHALAIEIIAMAPGSVPVDFEGLVKEIHETYWLIGDRRVEITAETRILGPRAPGKTAEVRATPKGKWTLTGQVIRVLDTPDAVTLGALVTSVTADASGGETWNVLVFPSTPLADPVEARVTIAGGTLVNQSRAIAGPGRWAQIVAAPTGQNTYEAHLVRVEQPVPVSMAGRAQYLSGGQGGAGWWQVGNRLAWISREAATVEMMQEREHASWRGLLLGNGVVWVGPLPDAEMRRVP